MSDQSSGAPGRAASHRLLLVVGHDRHQPGRRALQVAADLGRRLDADLRVIHVVDLDDYPIDPDSAEWDQYAAAALDSERREVGATLAGYPGRWTFEAVRGDPVLGLARAAEDCDAYLIVVGTRGRGARVAFTRVLGGSVSRSLLGHTDRPVLVVPSDRVG